jgi:hypothetical protein
VYNIEGGYSRDENLYAANEIEKLNDSLDDVTNNEIMLLMPSEQNSASTSDDASLNNQEVANGVRMRHGRRRVASTSCGAEIFKNYDDDDDDGKKRAAFDGDDTASLLDFTSEFVLEINGSKRLSSTHSYEVVAHKRQSSTTSLCNGVVDAPQRNAGKVAKTTTTTTTTTTKTTTVANGEVMGVDDAKRDELLTIRQRQQKQRAAAKFNEEQKRVILEELSALALMQAERLSVQKGRLSKVVRVF